MTQLYLDDIRAQPDVLRRLAQSFSNQTMLTELRAVREAIEGGRTKSIILTAMGGSFHGAYGTWLRLSQLLPVPVTLWDTSELIQQAPGVLRADSLVIAVSQSGESAEIKRLGEFCHKTSSIVSITNGVNNTLARLATVRIATLAGPEDAVSTKTYTAGLAALYLLESVLLSNLPSAQDEVGHLAEAMASALPRMDAESDRLLAFLGETEPVVFIGRGPSLSSASMGALITAEATKRPSMAYSAGQFRHGPLELVRDGFTSVLFTGTGPHRRLNERTAAAITQFGGMCLAIGPVIQDFATGDHRIRRVDLPVVVPALLPVLEIVPIQFLMVPMARARGFEPATFLNGTKVTSIE